MGHHKHTDGSSAGSSGINRHKRHHHRVTTSNSSASLSSSASTNVKYKRKEAVPRSAWENIVIHYLSKLKNYWCNDSKTNQEQPQLSSRVSFRQPNEMREFREPTTAQIPSRYCSRVHNDTTAADNAIPNILNSLNKYSTGPNKKAYNIVANALEYGVANGIVSNNGNYFWLSEKVRRNRSHDSIGGSSHMKNLIGKPGSPRDVKHSTSTVNIRRKTGMKRMKPRIGKKQPKRRTMNTMSRMQIRKLTGRGIRKKQQISSLFGKLHY